MAAQKAIVYLRVSGLGQADGDGFTRQAEAVAAYARRAGLVIVEPPFRDTGVSGTKDLEDRPGLAALLDRIESNGVRVVIVERADRLARDLIVSETILGQFRERGVKVFDAEGNELTAADGDPTRTLIRQVLGAVAEFDRAITVAKLRAARARVRRSGGRCEGRKPFGSTPAEKEILDRILDLRRGRRAHARLSFGKIAEKLNAEKVSTRTGAPWAPATVYGIVRANQPRLTSRGDARDEEGSAPMNRRITRKPPALSVTKKEYALAMERARTSRKPTKKKGAGR